MEYGRNLHRTSKASHTITKPSSSSSSSTSSSTSSDGSEGRRGSSRRPPRPVPVIRVVHIFNPTVIKTDVAHFRSLVQELTGSNGVQAPKRCVSSQAAKPDVKLQTFPAIPRRNPMYIPERLGSLSDIDIISSFQEPAVDLSSILPAFGEINEESLSLLPRFSSLYGGSF